jgi:hypothetical protein
MASKVIHDTCSWSSATIHAVSAATNAELQSTANNTAISTTFLCSSVNIAGNNDIIEGIMVRIYARAASPNGTLTVGLSTNGTTFAAGASVAVNISDMDANGNGWVFCKFTNPFTIATATNYKIAAQCSNTGSQVTLYRDATAANFTRMLVINGTSTAQPAASDGVFLIAAAGAAAVTITFDANLGADQSAELNVCKGAILAHSTTATTRLRFANAILMNVWGGGEYDIGTSAARIGSSYTAALSFTNTAGGNNGLVINAGGTWKAGGCFNSTGATSPVFATLNGDIAGGATSLTTNEQINGNWVTGDEIVIAGTTRTNSQNELKTLTSVGSYTCGWTGGLANAHRGTVNNTWMDNRGEVAHLTRNVSVYGVTSASYVNVGANTTVDVSCVKFTVLGINSATKTGVCFTQSAAAIGSGSSWTVDKCVFRDSTVTSSYGLEVNVTTATTGISCTLSNNVFYALTGTTTRSLSVSSWTITSRINVTGNLMVGCLNGIFLLTNVFNADGNRIANCTGTAVTMVGGGQAPNFELKNSVIHSLGTGHGVIFNSNLLNASPVQASVSNNKIWCIATSYNAITYSTRVYGVTFDSNDIYECVTGFATTGYGGNHVVKNTRISGTSTYTCAVAVDCVQASFLDSQFITCEFGQVNACTTEDVRPSEFVGRMWFYNCKFSTWTAGAYVLGPYSVMSSSRHNQTEGAYQSRVKGGTIYKDANGRSGNCSKMTVTSGISPGLMLYEIYVASGVQRVVTFYVKTAIAVAAETYQTRVIYRGAEVVIATTFTPNNSTWTQVTVTIPAVSIPDTSMMELWIEPGYAAGQSLYVDDMVLS